MKKDSFLQECDEENFHSFVEKSREKFVLFYFHASWCGPCRMLKPLLNRFAEEHEDKLVVASIDVDQSRSLADKFDIFSIPMLFLYKNGELCESCSSNTFNLSSVSQLEEELLK